MSSRRRKVNAPSTDVRWRTAVPPACTNALWRGPQCRKIEGAGTASSAFYITTSEIWLRRDSAPIASTSIHARQAAQGCGQTYELRPAHHRVRHPDCGLALHRRRHRHRTRIIRLRLATRHWGAQGSGAHKHWTFAVSASRLLARRLQHSRLGSESMDRIWSCETQACKRAAPSGRRQQGCGGGRSVKFWSSRAVTARPGKGRTFRTLSASGYC